MKDTITIPLSVLESLCDDVEIDLNNTQDDIAMKAINSLKSERDELKRQLENFNVSSIHSCHAQCKRPMCVLRRERDKAREALEHITEYGTEEINAAVELRQKLATALLERDDAREELKKLEGAYEDATNYYARMIELREELDQVKEQLKNKTYDQLKS